MFPQGRADETENVPKGQDSEQSLCTKTPLPGSTVGSPLQGAMKGSKGTTGDPPKVATCLVPGLWDVINPINYPRS